MKRDICGTESGYRKHRRESEEKCQPCKDAHNVHRRATYNPEANKRSAQKYKAKERARKQVIKAAKQAAKVKAYEAKVKAKEEETREYLAIKERVLAFNQLVIVVKPNRKEFNKTGMTRAQIDAMHAEKRRERKDAIEQRKADRKARSMARKALEREQATVWKNNLLALQKKLTTQHGTIIADYTRCKKINGTACNLCKAFAAKYMRDRKKANPDMYKISKKKYFEKYPHKKTELNRRAERKRRAHVRGVKHVPFTVKDAIDLWGTDCHICNEPIDMKATRKCGEPGWEKGLHLDHVIPISKGGPDVISNVKPAHAKCNVLKSDKF